MIEIKFKWGEPQPSWVTNASQYARIKLGLWGAGEATWMRSTLGYITHETDEGFSLIFEDDKDYTMAILKWA